MKIKLSRYFSLCKLIIFVIINDAVLSSSVPKIACTCGRILDFEKAKHGSFPWTAAIVGKYDVENEVVCWGSLINNFYILSAAHCTSQFDSTEIEVILNTRVQTSRRAVAKIKNHPGFKIGHYTYDNDISLVKLRDPADLENEETFSICLPPEPPSFYEDSAVKANFSKRCQDCDFVQNPEDRSMVMSKISGFESGFPYLIRVPTFSKVNIFVLKNETCANLYPNRIKAQYLCGLVKQSEKMDQSDDNNYQKLLETQCQDDGGSALIHLRKMRRKCDPDYESSNEKVRVRFVQIGISSEQNICRKHFDKPVLLFTRIKRYVTWIKENTYDGAYCKNSPM